MIKISRFTTKNSQMSYLGRHQWSVARLIELPKDLTVMEIPLEHLNIYHKYGSMTLRCMVGHIKAVNEVDLSFPIILDEDGEVMDGRHRIMRALRQLKRFGLIRTQTFV